MSPSGCLVVAHPAPPAALPSATGFPSRFGKNRHGMIAFIGLSALNI